VQYYSRLLTKICLVEHPIEDHLLCSQFMKSNSILVTNCLVNITIQKLVKIVCIYLMQNQAKICLDQILMFKPTFF